MSNRVPQRDDGGNGRRAGRHGGQSGASRLRQARFGVAIVFLLTGFVFATWASRIPAVKADLALSDGDLTLAFMGLNAGAIAGLQLGGALVPRFGSRPTLRIALPGFAAALVAIALATSLPLLMLALVVSAAANSVVDVAMNTHGVAVERRYERPILSGLHAMHPVGGMAGAGFGALAAWLATGTLIHFGVVALVVSIASILASRLLLPATVDAAPVAQRPGSGLGDWLSAWRGSVIVFGVLAFCVTLAEGAALDWGAVWLDDALGAGPGVAAAGVALFMGGIAAGRFAGDALILRFGPGTMFRAGALAAGLGFGASLLLDSVFAGIVGLTLLGAGILYLLPLLISAAGRLHNDDSAAASVVARVSTLGYLGSFVGPALIGAIAGVTSLPLALALPALLVAGSAFASRRVASTADEAAAS